MSKDKVIGYIFNDEAQALLKELVLMRSCLGVGEFFSEQDRQKYHNLSVRLNKLMGRYEHIKERF